MGKNGFHKAGDPIWAIEARTWPVVTEPPKERPGRDFPDPYSQGFSNRLTVELVTSFRGPPEHLDAYGCTSDRHSRVVARAILHEGGDLIGGGRVFAHVLEIKPEDKVAVRQWFLEEAVMESNRPEWTDDLLRQAAKLAV